VFSARQRPLRLSAGQLLAVRLSLNTPVVSTLELEPAPSRAAIFVHEEGGSRRVTVAVRSLPDGASALYELEGEDLDSAAGFAVGFDAALTFAESMGFLLDDELISGRSPAALRRALAALREIVPDAAPAADDPPEPAAVEDAPEILLEDPFEARPRDLGAEGSARPVALTKFRESAASREDAPAPARRPASTQRAARLGRVRPVRVRAAEGALAPNALIRLLSAF
jgi:hypothetical protein